MAKEQGERLILRYSLLFVMTAILLVPSYIALVDVSGESDPDDQGAASPPTRGWLDIAVDGIEVRRPSASNNLYPGQRIQIWVKLVHDDTPEVSDTAITFQNQFTVVLVIDDGFTNVTQFTKQVRSMTTNYTGKDQPHTGLNPPMVVDFWWIIPSKKPPQVTSWSDFQYKVSGTITIDDDDKSDNFRTGSGIRISEPEFQPYIWEEGQKEGEIKGPPHDVSMSDPAVIIPFELRNEGPAMDNIGVEIVSAPEGWIVDGFTPQTVYPSNVLPLDLPVQISRNPFLSLSDVDYLIIVRAYSDFYPDGPYVLPTEHQFHFRVNFKPGAQIKPKEPDAYLVPGLKSNINFILRNTGNGVDTYTLNVPIDETYKKRGWDAGFVGQTGQVDVKPSEEKLITVWVKVPIDAVRFSNMPLKVNAQSSNDIGYSAKGESCTIFADIRYAAKIEDFFEASFLVEPGRENIIKFNFTNMGNDRDPNQHIVVTYQPIGWAVYVDQTPLKRQGGLGVYSTVLLTMTVYVKETSQTTAYATRPRVILEARGGPYDHTYDDETFFFEVPLRRKIEFTSPVTVKEGHLGGQVEFLVNVRNLGNWEDIFNLSVDHPWAELEETVVRIIPNETYPVKLIVKVPQDAAADTNPETPLPNNPAKNWYDPYRIRVSGYSQNETKKGATLSSIDFLIHVQPFYGFTMEMDSNEKPLQFSTDHDQSRTVKIKLANLGNIYDLIWLDWDDNPYTWVTLKTRYVNLPYADISYGIISFDIDAFTIKEDMNITLALIGTSKGNKDLKATPVVVKLNLTIEFYQLKFDILEPRVNNESFGGKIFQGTQDRKYSIQVPIQNIGTVDLDPTKFKEMDIVLYDGPFEVDRANITYLVLNDTKEVVFVWVPSTPGSHNMVITLEGELPISDSDRGVLERSFIVTIPMAFTPDDDDDKDIIPLWMYLLPLMFIILFIAAIFVFVTKYNQIYISPVETGYDEKGEYRPWAIKEQFKEEAPRLEPAPREELKGLPAPSRPGLPPAPAATPSPAPHPVPTGPAHAAPMAAAQPIRMAQPVKMATPVAAPGPVQPAPAQPQPVRQATPMPQPVSPIPMQRPMTTAPVQSRPMPMQPAPVQRPMAPAPGPRPQPIPMQPTPVQRPTAPAPVQSQPRPVQPAPAQQPRPAQVPLPPPPRPNPGPAPQQPIVLPRPPPPQQPTA